MGKMSKALSFKDHEGRKEGIELKIKQETARELPETQHRHRPKRLLLVWFYFFIPLFINTDWAFGAANNWTKDSPSSLSLKYSVPVLSDSWIEPMCIAFISASRTSMVSFLSDSWSPQSCAFSWMKSMSVPVNAQLSFSWPGVSCFPLMH